MQFSRMTQIFLLQKIRSAAHPLRQFFFKAFRFDMKLQFSGSGTKAGLLDQFLRFLKERKWTAEQTVCGSSPAAVLL